MTFDLEKIIESKRAMRRELAAKPVAEKLKILERMRDAAVSIRRAGLHERTE